MNTIKTRNTVTVFARHKEGCAFRKDGDKDCKCPKYLLIYEADQKKNRMESARTTSWNAAENAAQGQRDKWDPREIELNQHRAKKELEQVSVVDAVSLFTVDKVSRLGDNGTVELARTFFGDVDPKTREVKREGHLFTWLASLPSKSRPVYIRDINVQHLTNWRAGWTFKSDLTRSQRWNMVKGFFGFCQDQGWIEDNPARKLKPMKVAKGNRTAVFTDQQMADILDAVDRYNPEFTPAEVCRPWQQRIRTFIELLRWSAMDLVDAIEFRPELVTGHDLRYRRQKTGVLATVKLPEHVVVLLRSVPLEPGSGPEKPFRTKETQQNSNVWKWQYRLGQVFKLAGITNVQTDMRTRRPHCKMFRDTAAVWWLRHGVPVHSVAKALGHASVTTTERAYLPWVKELENAHLNNMEKVMEAAAPKVSRGITTIRRKA